jgi:hypothetical protein
VLTNSPIRGISIKLIQTVKRKRTTYVAQASHISSNPIKANDSRRIGYGQRKIVNLSPLDAELNLPVEQYSYGIRERVAAEVAVKGFTQTVETIKKTTAAKVEKRQVEQLARSSSVDFDSFYSARQAESKQLEQKGEILVITTDGKGVIMRTEDLRPATQKRALNAHKKLDKRLTKGEKRNSKRMATVASVYTIDPFIRTAEQILAVTATSTLGTARVEWLT